MERPVLRLYPVPGGEQPLVGSYLAHDLRCAATPCLYTNFITSLDGRIAQPDPATGHKRVPPAIANPRDWRLYLELAAQADALLTTARHLRAVVAGRSPDLLSFDGADDLVEWRRHRGLAPEPILAVLSLRLALPWAELPVRYRRRLLVITAESADDRAVAALTSAGIEVVRSSAPDGRVDGRALKQVLAARGLHYLYSIAGPQVHHTLLAGRIVDWLFLTTAHQLLGGEPVDTLVTGPWLSPAPRLELRSLLYDPHAPAGGQLFAAYRCRG